MTGAEIGALVAAGAWHDVHHHVRADVAKTTALARRIGVLTRGKGDTPTGKCSPVPAPVRTASQGAGSAAPDLAFPKPFPQILERRERRRCQQARERRENAKVRQRSGGQCEVVLGQTRCRKPGHDIHHLVGGHGRRGRGASALATHKVHACLDHHRLMGLKWIAVTWTTAQDPVSTMQFAQVRGTAST